MSVDNNLTRRDLITGNFGQSPSVEQDATSTDNGRLSKPISRRTFLEVAAVAGAGAVLAACGVPTPGPHQESSTPESAGTGTGEPEELTPVFDEITVPPKETPFVPESTETSMVNSQELVDDENGVQQEEYFQRENVELRQAYENGPYYPVYRVQPGETLSELAERFEVDLGSLTQVNGIDNPDEIWPDQELMVSGVRFPYYFPPEGGEESIDFIGKKFNVPLDLLLKLNLPGYSTGSDLVEYGKGISLPFLPDLTQESESEGLTLRVFGKTSFRVPSAQEMEEFLHDLGWLDDEKVLVDVIPCYKMKECPPNTQCANAKGWRLQTEDGEQIWTYPYIGPLGSGASLPPGVTGYGPGEVIVHELVHVGLQSSDEVLVWNKTREALGEGTLNVGFNSEVDH